MVSAKTFTLGISRAVFRFALFAGIGLGAVWWFFIRTPDTIKQSLADNNAYSQFISGIIEENKGQQGGLPLDDPRVETIVKETFPPELLQTSTEDFIDASYNWLNGKTQTVRYSLDVAEVRETFASKFSDYSVSRLDFLPACTNGVTALNPITTTCTPANINKLQVRNAAREAILQSSILPKDNIISTDKLPVNQDGKNLLQEYAYAPALFQLAGLLPWALLLIAAASGVFIVRLQNKRRGWRELGTTLVSTCIGLAVFTYIFIFLLPDQLSNQANPAGGGGVNQLQLLSQTISNDLIRQTQAMIINISIQLAVVGGVILIIEKFSRPTSSYSGVGSRSGLTSSISPKKSLQLGHGKYDDVPIVSSEGSKRKHTPRKRKKPSKARRIAKGLE